METTSRKTQPHMAQSHWIRSETYEQLNLGPSYVWKKTASQYRSSTVDMATLKKSMPLRERRDKCVCVESKLGLKQPCWEPPWWQMRHWRPHEGRSGPTTIPWSLHWTVQPVSWQCGVLAHASRQDICAASANKTPRPTSAPAHSCMSDFYSK